MGSYRSLKAWQVAHRLAREVAAITKKLPRQERFELTTSAPANLVEGYVRFGPLIASIASGEKQAS
jgi:hypothetical protein